ncbi:MAG: hypothetical protein HYU46_23160 [Deltaproteobacteria bacterium]|nr:hypothetical protein [Deltaproteobacteria bacterium]
MNSKPFHSLCVLAGLALLAGCAPYVTVGGKYMASGGDFEVDFPQGWRKHEMAFDNDRASIMMLEELRKQRELKWDIVRITRDGLMLQRIAIGKMTSDTELSHTKKRLAKDALPQEVAELIIDDFRSNSELQNQQLVENSPAKIAGYPGFKLVYSYQTKKGLTVKAVYYGLILATPLPTIYYLVYEAPERHYFAKDLPIFERLKETFTIKARSG